MSPTRVTLPLNPKEFLETFRHASYAADHPDPEAVRSRVLRFGRLYDNTYTFEGETFTLPDTELALFGEAAERLYAGRPHVFISFMRRAVALLTIVLEGVPEDLALAELPDTTFPQVSFRLIFAAATDYLDEVSPGIFDFNRPALFRAAHAIHVLPVR
ncbi:hypothetical protein DES53_115145 [Roseimicrobium gellanilyticum]|uniref:Uncharacterized protein n=1 Tax=Roseimicrobium gellanilyticum TaxID=748857 RepID=A0A366H4R2_9BACT|nr:hypothetical protein [Roseimicrobium gellanilyticum]RBP37004.1 hypothetical protein DES53_115145 [Roseimicrobium gellanilyticum]